MTIPPKQIIGYIFKHSGTKNYFVEKEKVSTAGPVRVFPIFSYFAQLVSLYRFSVNTYPLS